MKLLRVLFTGMFMIAAIGSYAAAYQLKSPSGKIVADIDCGKQLIYSITYDGQTVLTQSPVSMTLSDGTVWGHDAKVSKITRSSEDKMVDSPFTGSTKMRDYFNALTLKMKGDWSIQFRAYDDGVAYRFVNGRKKPFEIIEEQADFTFPEDFRITVPYVKKKKNDDMEAQFGSSFESKYDKTTLKNLDPKRLAFLPLSVDAGNVTAVITETDLNDYPGLYLYNPDGSTTLKSKHAPYPTKVKNGGHLDIQYLVTERADYIAKVKAPRVFPWRVVVIGNDVQVAESNLSYLLAEPSKVNDISWIRPGKVAWDWWNYWNLTGVDFEAGINTATYKKYIDFASKNGIEYVILDDGWAAGKGGDLMKVSPAIDLKEIIDYAASRNVGIILWAGLAAFERDMENICRHYAAMGVKGFKVDFEDRDDQWMTDFNHRMAETAARHKLVLDIHGTYKPAGINRTWPNVLNVEGVKGLENLKWSTLKDFDIIEYDTEIPFIRQVSGPMDYTQGAMDNGAKKSYAPINQNPMSQGTRAHQMALYMVLYSPLNMLCDSPSKYEREQECTDFIADVPTVWDETIVLDGKKGEYIVTARRSGDDWYIGGITNWTPRDMEIDLSRLNLAPTATMTIFRDGKNAHRNGTDYVRETTKLNGSTKLKVHVAPGGGFAAHITK